MKHRASASSLVLLGLGILALAVSNDDGVVSAFSSLSWSKTAARRAASTPHHVASRGMEPGQMRIAEIKAELDALGVQYSDCFDKDSMVQQLVEARPKPNADPPSVPDEAKPKYVRWNPQRDPSVLDRPNPNSARANPSDPSIRDQASQKRMYANPTDPSVRDRSDPNSARAVDPRDPSVLDRANKKRMYANPRDASVPDQVSPNSVRANLQRETPETRKEVASQTKANDGAPRDMTTEEAIKAMQDNPELDAFLQVGAFTKGAFPHARRRGR